MSFVYRECLSGDYAYVLHDFELKSIIDTLEHANFETVYEKMSKIHAGLATNGYLLPEVNAQEILSHLLVECMSSLPFRRIVKRNMIQMPDIHKIDIARVLNVSMSTFDRWINGRSSPSDTNKIASRVYSNKSDDILRRLFPARVPLDGDIQHIMAIHYAMLLEITDIPVHACEVDIVKVKSHEEHKRISENYQSLFMSNVLYRMKQLSCSELLAPLVSEFDLYDGPYAMSSAITVTLNPRYCRFYIKLYNNLSSRAKRFVENQLFKTFMMERGRLFQRLMDEIWCISDSELDKFPAITLSKWKDDIANNFTPKSVETINGCFSGFDLQEHFVLFVMFHALTPVNQKRCETRIAKCPPANRHEQLRRDIYEYWMLDKEEYENVKQRILLINQLS